VVVTRYPLGRAPRRRVPEVGLSPAAVVCRPPLRGRSPPARAAGASGTIEVVDSPTAEQPAESR